MEERVLGAAGSGPSDGRRRRLRAMIRGYPMLRWPMHRSSGVALAVLTWAMAVSPALADSGSRYSAPLWAWVASIAVAVGLGVIGLGIGVWFLRKRARIESSD
ncbi:MAG: hypothetical protein OXG27_00020 [Chloroflexi bacterium]|nr:hypothetical protein [Chloroflexota bacterium]